MSQQLSKLITLPHSRYGFNYSLDKLNSSGSKRGNHWSAYAHRRPLSSVENKTINGTSLVGVSLSNVQQWAAKKKTKKCPYEEYVQALTIAVRRLQHPEGTALLYIREIFEPDDPEFDFLEADINVCQLTREQVGRLRILIVPTRREEYMLAYIEFFDDKRSCLINSPATAARYFDGFKRRFKQARDVKEKFDLIFSFSFAMKKFSSWMHFPEFKRGLEKMVSTLARHWRDLLQRHFPEELGLDRDFSYPAVLAFLRNFKKQIESIDVFGSEPIRFDYDNSDSFGVFDDSSPLGVASL